MANNEQVGEHNALVTEQDEKQVIPLMRRVRELIRDKRLVLENKITHCREVLPTNQCSPDIVALFLMAEKVLHFNDDVSRAVVSYLKNHYKTNARNIHWAADKTIQVEQYLWTLYVEKETKDGFSLNDYKNMLSECFRALKKCKNPCLSMMLWLASEFATEDWLSSVQDILEEKQTATWLQQDRMLFLLACMENSNCSIERARDIETQIRGLQLGSGAFAAGEGKAGNGNLISSAIGLLVLISCARRKGSRDSVIDAVRQAVRWIVEQIAEANDKGVAWAYYALCEYIDLESTTKGR